MVYVKWQKLAALEAGYNRIKSLERTWFPSRKPRFFIILTEKTPSSKRSKGGGSSMFGVCIVGPVIAIVWGIIILLLKWFG
ncbi:hypothetical protein COM32_02645 [Bacillus pseudomycoides]|nr:hypothetical protein CN620_10245 [Bacillus pseudomycoides]PEM18049.1 hypothetical protein CN628_09620 [Bacillus pseudomycoides]PGA29473.1 hypothetical protein COL79_01555 [Bacillus pseudomycoides]PGD31061.1 hypothetical protein COM32_02645 [Bacillus pseudomycoides]